jgi:DNA-binding response OmpR family regulator
MKTLVTPSEPAIEPTAITGLSPTPITTSARPFAVDVFRAQILLVDDEPHLRKLGELALIRSGYVVDTAADGAAAWEMLQHTHYNLLITDNDMPRLTGLELVSNARLAGMRLPIVMTSGSDITLRDSTHAWLEVAAFMHKPFRHDSLVATVEQVLQAANKRNGGAALVHLTSVHARASVQSWTHGGINE